MSTAVEQHNHTAKGSRDGKTMCIYIHVFELVCAALWKRRKWNGKELSKKARGEEPNCFRNQCGLTGSKKEDPVLCEFQAGPFVQSGVSHERLAEMHSIGLCAACHGFLPSGWLQ